MKTSAEERYQTIYSAAKADSEVIGFVVGGSRGKGFEVKESDYDLVLIVSDECIEGCRKKYDTYDGNCIDLNIFSLSEFREHAAYGGQYSWDRYNYAHLKASVDKKDGLIQKLINEKGCLPDANVPDVIHAKCDHFINQFYRALKCLRDGNSVAAKLELSESVGPLLDAMFAVHGRLKPYYKYLWWELENYPLEQFPWTSERLYELIQSLSNGVKPQEIREVLVATEKVFREKGHGAGFDRWSDDLKWMKSEHPT